MSLFDYFIPPSVAAKLTDILLGIQRIEVRLAANEGLTENLLHLFVSTGETIMTSLTELKELTTTAFAETSESLTLAITKIEELKAKLPNPEDGALADQIADSLRAQIAANDAFQAKLNPPADPAPVG